MPLNVAIFGSCVSRDAVGLLPEQLAPVHYTARQSWVSSLSPGAWIPPFSRLTSPFQLRMVRDDFRSSLFTQIANQSPSADLVLFDIIDDRLGVIEYFPKRFVTLSSELSNSGLLAGDRFLRRRRIHFGEDEHLHRFQLASHQVKSALINAGAWEKTLVVRAPWADISVEGESLSGEQGKSPAEWNRAYEQYYSFLQSIGFTMIEPPADLVFSTNSHKWGVHPIHYHQAASANLASQMLEFISTR